MGCTSCAEVLPPLRRSRRETPAFDVNSPAGAIPLTYEAICFIFSITVFSPFAQPPLIHRTCVAMAVDVRWMCGRYAGRVICLSNISWRIEYCFCRYKLFPDYIAQVEGLVFTNWVNYRTERTAFIINKNISSLRPLRSLRLNCV